MNGLSTGKSIMKNDEGKVTAVMITQNRERHRYVMMSIRSFLRQTCAESRLLIVNDGIPVAIDHSRIREMTLPFEPERTLGELRNIALDNVETPLVIQWDDDDWSHPERIARQVAASTHGNAVLLKRQLRYDLETGRCTVVTIPAGIDGTILHPVSTRRYPSLRRGEDSHFLKRWWDDGLATVIDNDPGLYVRLYTGHNTWSQGHIMSIGDPVVPPESVGRMRADLETEDGTADRLRTE